MTSRDKHSGFKGLCSTCNNSASCTFPRNLISYIWQCDEFDNSTPKKHIHKIKNKSAEALKKTDNPGSNDDTAENKGLCINCDNRDTCAHASCEGGIWHCENYL
ncbi:MAG: hypothetical protein JW822_06190 [Spirochaetales bacterium]|nr:hypothetical protein [Spirochaetales bacterium]